jgi:flagellar protein FliO/FliZ
MSAGVAGYLWDFTRSVLALLGAGALVWLLLRALQLRGVGRSDGPVRVMQRVPLEPRKALYVVRAGQRTLLIGCADGAAPALIAELAADASPVELPAAAEREVGS